MIVFSSKDHLRICAWAIMIYVIYVLSYEEWSDWNLIFCMSTLIGSLLPDIDHPNSISGYLIPAHLFLKHGTATHTLLFNSIFFVAYYLTEHPVWLGIGTGWLTHLIGDNFQGNNLKHLYYPYYRKKKWRGTR